ncbi:hypothetical protein A0H81_06520 [Grifola frondosa]|uniref:Fungal-type protein kinase domain-containing protein n=1 Tax=Grifola frondosa TaxID=5627 RepID=A0A1C7M9I1_GRIFR|nr:hypothetical protein A0H81_06520 [Grifola frondosa]
MAKVKHKEMRHAAKITGHWPDLSFDAANKKNMKQPDICIYPSTPEAISAYTLNDETIAKSTYPNLKKTRGSFGRVSWSMLSVPVEVKRNPKMAAFSYAKGKNWLPENDDARKARGQLVDYAREVLARQHRQFLFMIVIIKDHARLLRWDRVGAVVSEPFEYIKDPDTLGGFVWRYSMITLAQRGFDTTAIPATEEEVSLLQAYVKTLQDSDNYLKTAVNEMFSNGWPIHKVELDAEGFVDTDDNTTEAIIAENVKSAAEVGHVQQKKKGARGKKSTPIKLMFQNGACSLVMP